MKKLLIIPACMLLISSGITSNKPINTPLKVLIESVPVNTSLDTVNIRLIELSNLVEQL